MGDNQNPPPTNENAQATPEEGNVTNAPLNWTRLIQIVTEKKIDFALWVTRLLTLFFAAFYILPVFGNPVQFYYKAFMATAATSALRLHQRLPNVSLTRAFFLQLVQEDSFHYLFCCLIFIYTSPMTLALAPSVLFALLHFASFSLTLLDALGRNSAWIGRVFISLIEYKTVTILRMAAAAEIITMFFVIIYPLLGRSSLLAPVMYFRFLTFRYGSRRNHYTRTMFYESRIMLERAASSEKCPSLVATGIHKFINLLCKFAPPLQAAS